MGTLNCLIDLRMFDPNMFGERDQEKTTVTGSIERTVSGIHAVELTAVKRRKGEGVSPRTATTLAQGRINGILPQSG